MPGQFRPRGVTMRDCSKNRAGFDRVLMAVAATFLTVSATSALAQAGPPAAAPPNSRSTRRSRVPNPPTCRPRPSATSNWTPPPRCPTRPKADRAQDDREAGREGRRAETVADTAHRSRRDRRRLRPPQRRPAEPVKAASNVPPADQPVADKLRDMLGAKSLRYFDRKAERAAVEKFYTAREYAPLWTQSRRADRQRQGRHRAAQGCRRRGPERRRLSGAGFRRRDHAGRACRSRVETDRQHARLCAPGAERPDALVAGLGRHPLSRASDRSRRSAGQCHDRQGRVGGARGLQPAAQALQGIEGQARRIARPGRRTGDADRRRRAAGVQGRHQEAAGGRAGRSAGAATARQARHHRKPRRHPLRRQGRRSRAQVPGRRRPQADRRARRQDRQGDQQPEARPPDRHRDRQHGALALAAAPARRASLEQCLCHSQHPRLHAQGDAGRRAGLDHPRGDRQAGHRTPRRC